MKQEYVFKPPFDKHNTSEPLEEVYRATILEMTEKQCYTWVYAPVSLTYDDMKEDIANNVYVLGLKKRSGDVLYVPETYVLIDPGTNVTPYKRRVISIDLGMLPESLDNSMLLTDILAIVESRIGVTSAVKEVKVGRAEGVSDHEDREAARLIKQTAPGNYATELISALKDVEKLRRVKDSYECAIRKMEIT